MPGNDPSRPSGSAGSAGDLLTSLLRDVSRSFYLTLRVLPAPVRSQIGLAYLLARATDTIADTELIPVAERLGGLDILRRRILGESSVRLDFGAMAGHQALAAERTLLARVEEAVSILDAFEPGDRKHIRDVLAVITSGQELDLKRFASAGPGRPVIALAAAAELDDYTYRVAGCVGEFWTRMCVAHLFSVPRDPLDPLAPPSWFEACGVRFGKGLQLVNILRDLPRDLRQGRCYLPADALAQAGLKPADLLEPLNETRLRPVYDHWLQQAQSHLEAGWRYTCALPMGAVRLRLACAWPILIGAQTLAALRTGHVLDPDRRIKIDRAGVRRIISRTIINLPFRRRWQRLFTGER